MSVEWQPAFIWVLVALGVLLVAFFTIRAARSLNLQPLRIEYRREQISRDLRLYEQMRKGYTDAEAWLNARRLEGDRASRLSRVPREVRILFEDLDAALDYVEAFQKHITRQTSDQKRDFVKAQVRTGALALQLDNLTNTIRRMRAALREGEDYLRSIREDVAQIYFFLGTAFMFWGADEESEDDLQKAIGHLQTAYEKAQTADIRNRALFNLAWAFDELGRVSGEPNSLRRATEILQELIQVKPDDFSAHYNLACSLVELGEYREALDHLALLPGDYWELALNDADFAKLRSDVRVGLEFEELALSKRAAGQRLKV